MKIVILNPAYPKATVLRDMRRMKNLGHTLVIPSGAHEVEESLETETSIRNRFAMTIK